MRKAILCFAFLFAVAAFAQRTQHTPTVAQCRADEAAWSLEVVEEHDASFTHLATNTAAPTLIDWHNEMSACEPADPTRVHYYLELDGLINAELTTRLYSFLRRHNLKQQFLNEDAAGER
jgi:hypothetical protein